MVDASGNGGTDDGVAVEAVGRVGGGGDVILARVAGGVATMSKCVPNGPKWILEMGNKIH
jgi:hypothetical protein